MPVVSTRRLSTTGTSSYLPPSVGGTTSSLASLGKTTTSSGFGSSNYRSSSLSSSYSSGYSSGFSSGISTTSHLSRPSYRSGLYSSSSSLGGSTRTSSYLTGGNNDSTATLSSRFGVSNYRYSRSSSEKDTITSTRGLAGKTHISSNSINNNNNSYNNSNTTSTTTTASKSTTSIKNKTVQTKPPIGSFSKRQSLRENRPRDNSATRPLSIPDISKIGVTSKSDSDYNANNSKLTSLSYSSGTEDRGGIKKSSSLSSSSLALQVATSGLDIYEKYSPSNYVPKCELSRSRSLSEATPGSFTNDSNVTNSSSNVHQLLQTKENDYLKQQQKDDIDCVNKTVSSLSSSSLSASKDNNSTQTVNKVNIKLCDAETASAIIVVPSTNINLNGNSKDHNNSLKMYDSSIIINNSVSNTNAKKSNSLIENPNEANKNANAQCLADNNAIYIPFAESSASSNNKTTIDVTHNSQLNSIVAKAVDAIQNSTVIITTTTSVTSTSSNTTTIRIGNSKCTETECVSSTVVRKNSISSDAKVADTTDKSVLKGNNNFSKTFVNNKGGKINKIEVSHSHIIQTIDNKETLEKLLPTPSSQSTVKKREKDTAPKYHSNTSSKAGKVNEDILKSSQQPSPPPRTSSATAKSKVNNSITSSIKLKIPHAANNSLLQAAKLNLKSTKQYLSSKFDEKLIINTSYSYNLKSLNSNKNNLNNKSKKTEQSVVNGSVSTTISAKQSVQNSNKDIDNSNSNSSNQNPNNKSCSLSASTNKNNLLDFPLEFHKNKQRPTGGGGGIDHGIIGGNANTTNIHTYNIGGGCSNQSAVQASKTATAQPATVIISGNSVGKTTQTKSCSNSNNNNNSNNNLTSNCSDNTNNNNSSNNGNIGYRNNTHNQFFGQTQITSTYKDQNFLKREYEIARSQVIKNASNAEITNNDSTLRTDSTIVDDNTLKNKSSSLNTRTINNTKTINNNFKINVNIRDSSYISNSQEKLNKYGKNLIKPLVHKTTTNKFTAKLAKIITNNNMNCLQNNHENLDDIKFIDSDETDRTNQNQQNLLQQQQTTKSSSVKTVVGNTIATDSTYRLTQETSSLSSSSSSSSPMNMRKDINIVNNKNLITSSNNSSSYCKVSNTSATAVSSSAAVRTVPFTTKQSDIISTIQKNNSNYATDTPTHSGVSTLTNKFNSLTDLKRAPQPIISSLSNNTYYSSSSTSIRNMETTRKPSYISTTNIRPVGSAPSIVSTMATTTTTSSIKYPVPSATIAASTTLSSTATQSPKTSFVALNNHSSNAPSSRDSTPSNSPQFLRRRNILNSANSNMAQNLSQQQIKTAQLHQQNDTLPTISSSKPSSSSSASSTVIDKNLSNKLCDIEESVRSTSIRSALPPSPTLSRYWDREGRSAISSSRIATDLDDYTSTKTSVNSSYSYDKISNETREGLCGLRNIGNTCFMNSVIQCLSHTRELTKYLKNQVGIKSSSKDQQILYEFAKLIREMWSPSTRSVTPHDLKSAFSSKHRMYSGFNQQDAQEFLRFFLDSLHCALNTGSKADQLKIDDSLSDNKKADLTWEHYSKIENSVIKDLFVGQLKSTLKCTTCGNTSVTFDPFWDLSVPLPSSSRCKLDSCLDLFIREEVLDGDEMPTCSKCQTRRKCTKSLTIQRFPKYLVIHLKRFSETRWSKISNIVEFPTGEKELNMGPYASNSSSNSLYTLYGISNHMGSTAGGHYVALCKHPVTKKWHEFNDNVVSDEISESVLVSSSAYLLFYERA